MKKLVILGSTGSIGTQTLKVATGLDFKITALTANRNIDLLERQAREYKPLYAAVADEEAARELKLRLTDTPVKVLSGAGGIELCAGSECDVVLNALVGISGFAPTLAAIRAHNDIALANKETLVAGGELVMPMAKAAGVTIYPVDSEHSAIFQSLQGCADRKQVKKLILTASGGPFFGWTAGELENVTVGQALAHPNWSMGAKITVDSATMMNKGFELIEAVWLFGVAPENVEIVVHRQSVVHSLVEFCDNSVIAQLGSPDMAIPIQYALTYPQRCPSPAKPLSLTDYGTLTFEKPDYEVFDCLNICREAIIKGGLYPAAVNAANERAVEMFLSGKLRFAEIARYVRNAAGRVDVSGTVTPENVAAVTHEVFRQCGVRS